MHGQMQDRPLALPQATADHPLGRLGTPRTLRAAVAFLLSADAGWITGQTPLLDGGVTLH